MAPAMNDNMWRHPATRANIETLTSRGVTMVGPGRGWLACGTVDEGRMAEPEEILTAVRELAVGPSGEAAPTPPAGFWADKHVIVTAGPTHEPIDPVRYVANRSSGAMGYAVAAAAAARGARVTLISGPTDALPPRGLTGLTRVETASEMNDAVTAVLSGADWLIMAAAVADYAPSEPSPGKLKKSDLGERMQLAMHRNPDILAGAAAAGTGAKMVGFALETADVVATARAKLADKKLDYIVANDPTAPGSTFGPGDHRVTLLGREGVVWESDSLPKTKLAEHLLDALEKAES
jgi:phosphopantothenoylcysteine decarboxylase/phosphopantothenate--cysteine ligase